MNLADSERINLIEAYAGLSTNALWKYIGMKTSQTLYVSRTAARSKLNILSGAQVEAVYFRVEQFWNNPNSNLEAFSKY